MASFNDQVNDLRQSGNRYSVFREGVRTKWLTGQNGILFRILPAYNYEDKDSAGNINTAGWVACRTATGELAPWGAILTIHRYVGHGAGKSANRRDFLSPVTFTGDDKTFDPVSVLYQTAAMYPEWQYLVEDRREGSNEKGRVIERAALTRAGQFLGINIVELGGVNMPECVLGLCTKSTTDGLVNKEKNGLVYQRANNATPEMIAQNPMFQWALGDITDPQSGPVLYVIKGTDRGEYSGYQVGVAVDNNQQVRHFPIPPELLAARYDLTDPTNVAPRADDTQTVQELIETFNMRSPTMHHEHELLQLAFGDHFKIPDAPPAPAAMTTVASAGFPGMGADTGFGPAPGGAGISESPAMKGVAANTETTIVPSSPAAGPMGRTEASAPPAAAPAPKPAPSAAPVVERPATVPATDEVPKMTMSITERSPVGVKIPASAVDAPASVVAEPLIGAGPVAPGDTVSGFDRTAFEERLRSGAAGTAPSPQG